MKAWLVECTYDYWCQGWEDTRGYFLVYADSYETACDKVIGLTATKGVNNPRDFENKTIGAI